MLSQRCICGLHSCGMLSTILQVHRLQSNAFFAASNNLVSPIAIQKRDKHGIQAKYVIKLCQLLIIQHGKQMDEYQHWWIESDGRKPCQRVTASSSNALQTGLRHKPGLREARPAANRLTPRLHCSHNRQKTANQHLSGHTSPDTRGYTARLNFDQLAS